MYFLKRYITEYIPCIKYKKPYKYESNISQYISNIPEKNSINIIVHTEYGYDIRVILLIFHEKSNKKMLEFTYQYIIHRRYSTYIETCHLDIIEKTTYLNRRSNGFHKYRTKMQLKTISGFILFYINKFLSMPSHR